MLKELEEAIYNEFDIKVKAINSSYNSDENSYFIIVKIPKCFILFRNVIYNFICRYFPYMMYCEKFNYLVKVDDYSYTNIGILKFIEYYLMTEKQHEAFKNYIVPSAKRHIEVYYDDFEDEWDSPVYEELYKEYLKLLQDEDYKGLYYFIISNKLYR